MGDGERNVNSPGVNGVCQPLSNNPTAATFI